MCNDDDTIPDRPADITIQILDITYRFWLKVDRDDEMYYTANDFTEPSSIYYIDGRLRWSHEHDRESSDLWVDDHSDTSEIELERLIISKMLNLRSEIERILLGQT